MATGADFSLPPAGPETVGRTGLAARLNPAICFWAAAILIYGGAGLYATGFHFLDHTPRDIWQHLASLAVLIEDPYQPLNPFVPTTEGSRHFHPWWVSMAFLARALGWDAWQALAFAGLVSAGILIAGIHAFGRAFFRDPWGPFALVIAFTFSWTLPISHTGFHSVQTMVDGIAYPAALLIGLSFLLWALIIRALIRPLCSILIVPLAALMLATHQLGAGIGFIVAGCFIVFQPGARLRDRMLASAALGAGILLSCAWPYHSPFEAIARAGNASWPGGINFYHPMALAMAFVPSAIGLWGLLDRSVARRSLPITMAFLAFLGIFLLGNWGILIATRFMPPFVLMLQIGVAGLLLILARRWSGLARPAQLSLFGLALASILLQFGFTTIQIRHELAENRANGDASAALGRLTADVPDMEPVAAWDVAAWPLAASGQRVASVPWPEPMIDRLSERQADIERLFDPSLSRRERLAIARRWGVRTLVLDMRGPLRRELPSELIGTLRRQSVRQMRQSVFLRVDLE